MYVYCSGCGSCAQGNSGYSRLEQQVYFAPSYKAGQASYNISQSDYSRDISHMVAEAVSITSGGYSSIDLSTPYSSQKTSQKPFTFTYSPVTDRFLAESSNVFVGEVSQIKDLIKEAFEETTGKEIPKDIRISLLPENEFKKMNLSVSDTWNNGMLGFAINRKNTGLASEVFVRQGELGKVMLTLGHELGHVLSQKLRTAKDEEGKAFAFSLAWMKSIKQNNIGNLQTAIRLDAPARNGLHDVALDFVLNLVNQGADAMELYEDFVNKDLVVS